MTNCKYPECWANLRFCSLLTAAAFYSRYKIQVVPCRKIVIVFNYIFVGIVPIFYHFYLSAEKNNKAASILLR